MDLRRFSGSAVPRISRRRMIGALAALSALSALNGCGVISPGRPTAAPRATAASGGTAPAAVATIAAPTVLPSTPTPVPPTPTPVPQTLTLWTVRSDSPWLNALKQVAALFTASHPNVTVTVSGGHADFGKIIEGLGTDLAPDVIEPGELIAFAARSLVKPLDSYLSGSTIDKANYFTAMWVNGSWNGKQYGIPALDHGPELGFALNASLAGTTTAPTSWTDLYSFGQRLTKRDGSGAIQRLGFDPLNGVGGILDTVRDITGQNWFTQGSDKITLDNDAYQSFLQGIVTYYQAIGLDQLSAFRNSYLPLTNQEKSAVNLGREVSILDGYWAPGEIARFTHDASWKFAYSWMPTNPPGTTVQRLGGRVLAIPSVAPAPDASWSLIETLSGDPANKILCEQVGTCAMTRSFIKAGDWQARPSLSFYVNSMTKAIILTSRSNNVVAGFAQAKWAQAIGQVLSGAQSVPDALKAAQTAIQAEAGRAAAHG